MPTTISSWVQNRRASQEKWQKDPLEKEENFLIISAFEQLLSNKLSASSTASRINEIVSPRLISGLRASVGCIWGLFADATKHFGASHTQQLADVIIAIRELPDVANEEWYKVIRSGQVVWRGMPDFGWIFAEHGVQINGTDGMTHDEWHSQEEELLNATVLVATLMQRGGSFGIGMMYHAHDAFNEVERPFDDEREMADGWKMYIPPAEAWISIAGEKLFGLCFDKSVIHSAEPHERIRKAFNADRWALWKQRFAGLAEQEDIDERCRGLARKTVESMRDIEQRVQL
ncbi:hypothetical protein D6C86_08168 [Aureobasidium pullulans]|uniref:Uncharacterized protein n=1 Tax=Aureobasidium pullulans TaxID=5580 RepID=A0A4S9UYS2_AURPU|nr:hypothetical protein D6D29_01960 [Aureobasidium pullulans]THY76442.1 hypothetical protein D6C94_02984 [Aureobasidium pullulans]THZ43306.1 hypothetical protein D6C87_04409 [Aureobasidium pullulans]THZ56004.1 hypothetical protein D6C86_08168 [Aureobasidium pullulans]THZ69072.1 hypothetical protein D6C88_07893 [Aureobasidium pullulans]